MDIECWGSDAALNRVLYELKLIPPRILKIIEGIGFPILIFNDYPSLQYKGYLLDDYDTELTDGRDMLSCSHFSTWEQWIYIYEPDLYNNNECTLSVFLHEMGHALDWALTGGNEYFSVENTDSLFRDGTPMDWYAGSNNMERFASCFEAMFHSEQQSQIAYCDHNIAELYKKEYNTFKYLTTLFDKNRNIILY